MQTTYNKRRREIIHGSVICVTRLRAGQSGVRFPAEAGNVSFATASRLTLRPPSLISKSIEGFYFGSKTDRVLSQSPTSIQPRLRKRGATPPLPHTFMALCLLKHKDKFAFTLR